MNISKNKVVSLSYELRVDDRNGKIVETVQTDKPLTFIFGMGNLLPEFEKNIEGLRADDVFAFGLPCESAYGKAVEEAIVEIPKTAFVVDGMIDEEMLFEGNAIPMTDSDGNHLNGVIVEVKDQSVMMDFNHPLAGDDLFFSGTVVSVRDASEEEMAHGHIHGGCVSGGCDGCSGC